MQPEIAGPVIGAKIFTMTLRNYLNHRCLRPNLLVSLLILTVACNKTPVEPAYTPPDSSFGLIYSNIFEASCAVSGCHDGIEESPALLGKDTYANLIGKTPVNGEAREAGLLLIKANDPDSSFLYQKIDFDSTEFKFGSPMPQGGLTISDDQIAFVREWIEAGAPELGHVADRSLIE